MVYPSYTNRSPGQWMRAVGALAFLVLTLSACPTRYDPVTYRRLTDLKPVALYTVKSLANPELDFSSAEYVGIQIDQLYEYEKGKGPGNAEIVSQVEKIKNIYAWSLFNRKKKGPNPQEIEGRRRQLSAAFDIAIGTEQAKKR